MRFVLIDRITEIQPGESIQAVKNLTRAEEYLADHFPGFPIMPGVLMLESLTQTAAWLMRVSGNFEYDHIMLQKAAAIRYKNFISPGQTLHTECKLTKQDENHWTFKARGSVDGKENVSAKITLKQEKLSQKRSSLAATEDDRLVFWKKQFVELGGDEGLLS